ncbi:MAG: DUF922 domain-containing protein [Chitinophagaceae bacterium]|nr:DUF922 domain-containing protein [Chitinophagaceae bacterium]
MMIRLLVLLLIFSSYTTVPAKDELIPWESTRRLTWADFKASPDNNSENAALTSSGITFGWGFGEKGFSYEITCTFNKQKSWGRIKNAYILAHEQGHFDITEIFARKLKKAIAEHKPDTKNSGKELGAVYSRVMTELSQMQADYDQETDHSRVKAKQEEWLVKISKELASLEAYSRY